MLISNAWAQAAASGASGASLTGTVIQMLAIVLVFYLLLIRPQQKRMKKHEAELKAIKVGDKILTGGGLYATVTACNDDNLLAEIAPGVEVTLHRYTVREVVTDAAENLRYSVKSSIKHNGKKHKSNNKVK